MFRIVKNRFYAFLAFGVIGLLIAGCGNVQLTTLGTVPVTQPAAKFTPTRVPTPTFPSLPSFVAPQLSHLNFAIVMFSFFFAFRADPVKFYMVTYHIK